VASFRNSILIDLLPELFPPGFRERERAPEYGKETFFDRMMREIDHVKLS
jgi:hypothetical protein